MATASLPFRPHFSSPRRGRAATRMYADLVRVQAGDHRTDAAFLEYVAKEADELVGWTLVQKEAGLLAERRWSYDYTNDERNWAQEASRLLTERAERILESEEIYWSPLIDALLQHDAWDNKASMDGIHESQRQIRYWLEAIEKPSELNPILTFGAGLLLDVVGENVKKLTWPQAERLVQHPDGIRGLACNPAAAMPHAKKLITLGWTVWTTPLPNRYSDPKPLNQLRQAWLSMFKALTIAGAKLPAEVRTALLEAAERPVSDEWDSTHTPAAQTAEIAAIGADGGLATEELERLIALRPTGAALQPLMLAARATLEMHERILEAAGNDPSEEVWSTLLERHTDLPVSWLLRITRTCLYASPRLFRQIAAHASANEQVWAALLDSHRGRSLVSDMTQMPACLASRLVRERIREHTDDGEILARVLPHCATGAEWKAAFLKLAELSPSLAARELTEGRLPADAGLDRLDLLPLLSADASEVRVAALCVLSNVENQDREELRAGERHARAF